MTRTAVIFDLDGTLTDSMPMHAEAWVKAMREGERIEIGFDEAYAHEGEKAEEFGRYLFLKYTGSAPAEDRLVETVARYVRNYHALYETRFFPYSRELIAQLRRHAVPIGIVSGSKDVRSRFAEYPDFIGSFDAVVTGDDTPIGKPHPAPFLKAFELLKVKAEEALVIENAPFGTRAAVAAGAECWAVLNGSPLSADDLLALGASRAFGDLAELKSALSARLGLR